MPCCFQGLLPVTCILHGPSVMCIHPTKFKISSLEFYVNWVCDVSKTDWRIYRRICFRFEFFVWFLFPCFLLLRLLLLYFPCFSMFLSCCCSASLLFCFSASSRFCFSAYPLFPTFWASLLLCFLFSLLLCLPAFLHLFFSLFFVSRTAENPYETSCSHRFIYIEIKPQTNQRNNKVNKATLGKP